MASEGARGSNTSSENEEERRSLSSSSTNFFSLSFPSLAKAAFNALSDFDLSSPVPCCLLLLFPPPSCCLLLLLFFLFFFSFFPFFLSFPSSASFLSCSANTKVIDLAPLLIWS